MAKNPQRDRELLKHILCHIDRIKSKREAIRDLKDFISNQDIQEIVLFNFFQIGENLAHMSDGFVARNSDIEIRSIIDFRNIIAHGYGTINIQQIYTFLYEDLDELQSQLERNL